ncbi:adenosine deaminase [Vibrio algarum]|uniref:Adenine deaminase n=1 Tax=Vibrio algarum TaxID=3020714 RepID=A0ABT4YPP5_9VIBR|nr:adenosine deaminase [Vibrio sp. KJ40-1]MDB1123530.1 adenosine deaminase [Vibrio sp. KJ40-1]
MEVFIQQLPKIELHLHIEGSLEPELMFELAKRNQIELPYKSTNEIRAAYQFDNLQSFLDIYYQGANVLLHEQDFYDLTWAYLLKCKIDNVVHTEIFFDPQTHTERDISFDIVVGGIHKALKRAEHELGITSNLIMCFLRHLSEDDAFSTLELALKHKDKIIAVGLDSSEQGHPPKKFERVFKQAQEHGFLAVAHAGEEGPAQNIIDAIEDLKVDRVDHGVRCIDSESLMVSLAESKMPLTICPLSNTKLKVFESMSQHNILQLLRRGLQVTINSDDPAYFGGYMTDNFLAVASALPFSKRELAQLSLNAIDASFIEKQHKIQLKQKVNDYLAQV